MQQRQAHFPFSLFQRIGAAFFTLLAELGAVFLFFLDAVRHLFITSRLFSKVVQQIYFIGSKSLFVISLIGLFTGMVLGLQGYYTLVMFGSEGFLGVAVALTLIRELGPVLTAIMVTGRAGSAMAAEISTMRISDQIDALEVMDIPAMGYLVSPRLLASVIVFPMLTALFDVIGIIGGYVTGVLLLGINQGVYFYRIETGVAWGDVYSSLIKAVVFAVLVSIVSCYQGYFAHLRKDGSGAESVGNATTSAVVIACILILISDYMLTSFLL